MNPLSLFKCLAEETRLRCVLLIEQEGELCVCELMAALGESQPKISRHLAQLRSCELLLDRRQGQWVFYRINPGLPAWARQVLADTRSANRNFLNDNVNNLCRMGDRPQRQESCC
ncbi:MAG: metalloregulator ArsR/SmtB family transcription factor [Pseudomonadota bacterium]|nr:metalloregulator ArsR/SmtB family transcription factor [Pseudomonadota bacterium]